jgi:hypothetical protein
MNVNSWVVAALVAAVILAGWLLAAAVRRQRAAAEAHALDALDTVTAWPPEATRVMTQNERQAYQTLVRALPDHIVLAQVPLARFVKVPKRRSYGEWINRVGRLNADLLVCDKASEVLAVVELRSSRDSMRSRQRHERMARVLKAAGIRVLVWMEGSIPGPEAARSQVMPEPAAAPPQPAPGQRLPTELPVAEAAEFDADTQPMRDPAPSTWFDDFDSTPTPLDRGKDKSP